CGEGGLCPKGSVCQDGFCNPPTTPAGTCCPAPLAGSLFVDGSYRGFVKGSADCPFTSVSAAVRAVTAPGTVIHVARGTYNASGEQFPIDPRHGTSLVGAGAGATILDGAGAYDHIADGGYLRRFPRDWYMTLLVGDDQTTSRIADLTVRNSD